MNDCHRSWGSMGGLNERNPPSYENVREPSGCELTRDGRVATAFLDHQRQCPLGNLIYLVLVEEDLVEQSCHVQCCTCGPELFPGPSPTVRIRYCSAG